MTDVSSPPEYARTQLDMIDSPSVPPLTSKTPRSDDTRQSEAVRELKAALDYVGRGKGAPVSGTLWNAGHANQMVAITSIKKRFGKSKKHTCRPPNATAGLGCETITDALVDQRTNRRPQIVGEKRLVIHLNAPSQERTDGRLGPQRLDQLDLHRPSFHKQAADHLPRVLKNLSLRPVTEQFVVRNLVLDPLAGDSDVVKDQIV